MSKTTKKQLNTGLALYAVGVAGIVGTAIVLQIAANNYDKQIANAKLAKTKTKIEYGNCTFTTNGTIEEQVASLRVDV